MGADRDDHPAAVLELGDERRRHRLRRAGDDDRIERCMLGPSPIAVAGAHPDVGAAEPPQRGLGALRQWFDDFKGENLRHQFREHGRLISRAGADFQHAIGGLRCQGLGHEGHDVGL